MRSATSDFEFFDLGDVVAITSFLERPDYDLYAHNLSIALEHFNLAKLPSRLRRSWSLSACGSAN